jgi:hypothetical protein
MPICLIQGKGEPVRGKSLLVTAAIALAVVVGFDQYKARKAG